MPLESDSSRASPHYALAPTHIVRRVRNLVAGRHEAGLPSGCHDRADSAADSEQACEVSRREVALGSRRGSGPALDQRSS
jgi:hypothetical protein